LGNYSDLWLELKTAIKLTDRVADMVQIAWEKELTLTHEEREEIAIAVFSAETFATRIGLDISNRIFELIGTPSKDTKYGFDRYWRDLHTFGGVSMPWQGAPQNGNSPISTTDSLVKSFLCTSLFTLLSFRQYACKMRDSL
jgi:hypothetical protein